MNGAVLPIALSAALALVPLVERRGSRDHVYRDPNTKTYLVRGHEHSWGSFPTGAEARAFIKQVEAEDREFKQRQVVLEKQIRQKLERERAEFEAARAQRLKADRQRYEGSAARAEVPGCWPSEVRDAVRRHALLFRADLADDWPDSDVLLQDHLAALHRDVERFAKHSRSAWAAWADRYLDGKLDLALETALKRVSGLCR